MLAGVIGFLLADPAVKATWYKPSGGSSLHLSLPVKKFWKKKKRNKYIMCIYTCIIYMEGSIADSQKKCKLKYIMQAHVRTKKQHVSREICTVFMLVIP